MSRLTVETMAICDELVKMGSGSPQPSTAQLNMKRPLLGSTGGVSSSPGEKRRKFAGSLLKGGVAGGYGGAGGTGDGGGDGGDGGEGGGGRRC